MPEPRLASSRRYHPSFGRGRRERGAVPEFQRYELCEPLHIGRVTQTWRARTADGCDCVVKLPAAALSGDRGAARLIEREGEFLERAAQPGVVQALERRAANAGPVLVTEFLPGGDLVALAGSHPSHWAAAALEIGTVLTEIHRQGIVHRDVKPKNVLFDGSGRATLIDFALASELGKRCRIGGGTPAYRRETPSRDAPAAPDDDVYALAAMVYELLCGGLPFGSGPAATATPAGRRAALERLEHIGAAVGAGDLAEVVGEILTREPADVAAALADFRRALQAIITVRDR